MMSMTDTPNKRKSTHDVSRRFESAAWRSFICALRVRWNCTRSCVRSQKSLREDCHTGQHLSGSDLV
jgi:hypothetical protein